MKNEQIEQQLRAASRALQSREESTYTSEIAAEVGMSEEEVWNWISRLGREGKVVTGPNGYEFLDSPAPPPPGFFWAKEVLPETEGVR